MAEEAQTRVEKQFFLERDDSAPKKYVLKFLDGEQREPTWEEIVMWISLQNLADRVRELEADR